MSKGNLYWEIEFTALYHGATTGNECEKVDVCVHSHDFTEAYKKAEKMYDAVLLTRPDTVYCAAIHLRDDGTASSSARYDIYQTNFIHEENVTAFFSVGADKCWRLTWRG